MNATPYLSVIIPTFQRRDSVERELRALARQTLAPETFEVTVAIDGSQDGTREMVEAFAAPYRLNCMWQPNRGRAAARNAGVRVARGEVLVFFDDDMQPAPDCLAAHWRAHSGQSRLGVMGAVPIRLDETASPVAAYIGAKFNQHLEELARPDHQLVLRDFYIGHFSIRRALLLEAGGFDEAFTLYGNEDLELSLRLIEAGVRLIYQPEAVAYQCYAKDFSGLAYDTIAKGQTAVLLASKHPAAYASLQLANYAQGSFKWRWTRAGLLALSRLWPWGPRGMITLVGWLEKRQAKQIPLYYRFALDYCYFLGAQSALRENRRAGRWPDKLSHDADHLPLYG